MTTIPFETFNDVIRRNYHFTQDTSRTHNIIKELYSEYIEDPTTYKKDSNAYYKVIDEIIHEEKLLILKLSINIIDNNP